MILFDDQDAPETPREGPLRVHETAGCRAGPHQGHRRRRRRRQRGQPHDRRPAARHRVHRRQHRPAGAAEVPRADQAADRQPAHQGPGRRRRPGCRAQGGARGHRAHPRGAGGGGHGLPDRRPGRRHGHRRGADHRLAGGRDRRPDRGGGHQALRLRGAAPHAAGGARGRGAAQRGRHADHDPQRAPAQLRGARHAPARGLPHRRRRAAPGGAGHQRPDHRSRARSTSTSRTCGRS